MCVIFITLQNFCETTLMNVEFFCYLWHLDYEVGEVGDYCHEINGRQTLNRHQGPQD